MTTVLQTENRKLRDLIRISMKRAYAYTVPRTLIDVIVNTSEKRSIDTSGGTRRMKSVGESKNDIINDEVLVFR